MCSKHGYRQARNTENRWTSGDALFAPDARRSGVNIRTPLEVDHSAAKFVSSILPRRTSNNDSGKTPKWQVHEHERIAAAQVTHVRASKVAQLRH